MYKMLADDAQRRVCARLVGHDRKKYQVKPYKMRKKRKKEAVVPELIPKRRTQCERYPHFATPPPPAPLSKEP